jgi:hypothetical protein
VPTPPNSDTLLHAYGLLELALSHYFPSTTEPDDPSVRAMAKAESESTLDELLAPLVMLLCKLVAGDTGACERLRERLLPANLDRAVVLESRADTLGRLLRLLTNRDRDRVRGRHENPRGWEVTPRSERGPSRDDAPSLRVPNLRWDALPRSQSDGCGGVTSTTRSHSMRTSQ